MTITMITLILQTLKRQIREPDVEYSLYTKGFQFKDPGQPVRVKINTKSDDDWIVIVENGEEGVSVYSLDAELSINNY